MIGIIIGDLMASNDGQLNENSTFTNVTTNATAVMEWLTKEDLELKDVIRKWNKKYKKSGTFSIAGLFPIVLYSHGFSEATEIYLGEAVKQGLDEPTSVALIDLIEQVKLKKNKEKLPQEFKKAYGVNEITKVLKEFAESKGFWEAVTKALKLEGAEATNASLAGGLAGIYYGLSKSIRDKALSLLPKEMRAVILEFEKQSAKRNTDEAIAQLRFIQM